MSTALLREGGEPVQAQEPVGYVVVNTALIGADRVSLPYPGTLYLTREMAQKNADLRNGREEAFNGTATYTVLPVGASPVASAPDAPPNAIRPESVWADGTVRRWWVDDGDGPKVVSASDTSDFAHVKAKIAPYSEDQNFDD